MADSGSIRTLNLLRLEKNGGFIAAGVDSLLNYAGPINNSWDDSLKNYWFARISSTGTLQHLNKISMQQILYQLPVSHNADTTGIPNDIVRDILPVNGDSVKYVIHINRTNFDPYLGLNIEADSNFKWLGRYKIAKAYYYENSFYHDSAVNRVISLFPPPVFVGLFSTYLSVDLQNGKYRFYYSNPGDMSAFDPNNPTGGHYFGTVLSEADIPLEPPPAPRGTNPQIVFSLPNTTWDEFLGNRSVMDTTQPLPHVAFYGSSFLTLAQQKASLHAAHLKQAINGNLFVYREAQLPVDSGSTDENHLQSFLTPFVFRVDQTDSGRVEWDEKIQYAPTKNDSSVTQHILDMSVAPSGCLVMGGYVNVNQTIPGYDSLGKNSWLVVLCDSLHDHDTATGIQIPEAGSQAEFIAYPNPTPDNAFVVLKHFEGNLQDVGIQLCDLNGRVLQNLKCNSEKVWIRLNGYASGIYLIKISYKGKPCGTVKLVKD